MGTRETVEHVPHENRSSLVGWVGDRECVISTCSNSRHVYYEQTVLETKRYRSENTATAAPRLPRRTVLGVREVWSGVDE